MAFKRKAETQEKQIVLIPILEQEMCVTLVGTSLLCTNNFSQKAKDEMADKQKKTKSSTGKAARNPKESWEGAFYRDAKGRPAIPAHCLKAAIIFAAHQDKGIERTKVRGGVFVRGTNEPMFLQINGAVRPFDENDMDAVRNASGVADLRWRPKWDEWSMDAIIRFDPKKISETQLLSLLFEAGRVSGLGEGRPEKSPLSWGMFAPDLKSVKLTEPRDTIKDIIATVERAKMKLIKKTA